MLFDFRCIRLFCIKLLDLKLSCEVKFCPKIKYIKQGHEILTFLVINFCRAIFITELLIKNLIIFHY